VIKEMTSQLVAGTNNISIPAVNTLPNGMYTVMMDNGNSKPSVAQFIKQ
jgi:hypothetical protein